MRRRFLGARRLLTVVVVAALLTGCGTTGVPKAAHVGSHLAKGVPAGWKSVTFGGLEVSVPATWRVQPVEVNDACGQAKPNAVNPEAYTRVVVAACPSEPAREPPPSFVTISCLYGSAAQGEANPTSTTRVDGRTLRWTHAAPGGWDLTLGAASRISALSVVVPADPGLGETIFHSVRPSTGHC